MKRLLFHISIFAVLTSCSSAQKHLGAIDSAITEIQNGQVDKGRDQLEDLCRNGVHTACALNGHPGQGERPLPILQSVTSEGQARFVVVVPKSEKFTYYVRSDKSITRLQPEHFEHAGSDSAVDQLEAFNLNPSTHYDLVVMDREGVVWDRRSFRSLNLTKRRGRFAITSCMEQSMDGKVGGIWAQLESQRPDAIFMIGENLHREQTAGAVTPDDLWKGYVETRTELPIFKADPLIPIIAVWNDHDYGKNGGDRTFAYKNESSDIFLTFFAQRKPAPGFERGPGIAAWWNAFGVHFAFLDDCSFRSPDRVDLPDQTHFGSDQEKWLNDHLTGVKDSVFLVSSDLFFGKEGAEPSFENDHPRRFQRQVEEWRQVKEPLVFVSGESHLKDLVKVPAERLGYTTFEVVAGLGGTAASNQSRQPGQFNYVIMELIRSDQNFIQFDAQAFGPDEKQLFQKTLTVKR